RVVVVCEWSSEVCSSERPARTALRRAARISAAGRPADVLTTDRLTDTYGIRIDVDTDPLTGRLRTRAVGRHHARTGRLSTTS
ncbi:hypothetical protein ACWEBX_37325, partial [Streptomyces sp. NPDC005070]